MKFISYLNKNKYFILFLLLGLAIFLSPFISAKFSYIIGGNSQNIYNAYVFEHFYSWIIKNPTHHFFWDAPFNYDNLNMLSHDDILLGLCPIYLFFRIFIKNPFDCLFILYCVCCFLNYFSFYCLLSNLRLGLTRLAKSVSSFVFAFSIIRFSQNYDIAYFSQFLTIFSIIFLFKVNKNNKTMKNHAYFLLAALFLILQFYSCYDLGFFVLMSAIFSFFIALIPKNTRDSAIDFIKNFYGIIIFYFFVVVMMLLPMGYHFIMLGKINDFNQFYTNIFNGYIWIKNLSVLDSLFYFKMPYFDYASSFEANYCYGFFVILFAFSNLFFLKKYKGYLFLTLIFIYSISQIYFGQYFWRVFYILIPSTEGLDGVNRILFVGLIIISILIGFYVSFFQKNKIKNNSVLTKTILILSIMLIVFEQIPYNIDKNSYWKSYSVKKSDFKNDFASVNKKIPNDCKAFYLTCEMKNEGDFGKDDIEIKKLELKKYCDLISMYQSFDKPIYSLNNYFEDSEKKDFDDLKTDKKKCSIVQIVDINKI